MREVILHLSDWDYEDRYYQLPAALLDEFREQILTKGLGTSHPNAWDWFIAQSIAGCIKYGLVDMRLGTFFLDWHNVLESLSEWEPDLSDEEEN